MDHQKQEKLIQKIVENEIDKVKRESQQLLQAIQVESEERLRETLNVFQKKELAMQDAFNKAILRAEAYGKRKAEQKLKGEMEALIERVTIAEKELLKEKEVLSEKEQEWKKERFEWQVYVERALLSENGYKKNFRKVLRKIKLEFRYSLNEAKSDLMDKAKDIASKQLRKKLYTDVRKDIIKSQLKQGQETLIQVYDGTLWEPLYKQMLLKIRLLRELDRIGSHLQGDKNYDRCNDAFQFSRENRFFKLNHVENIREANKKLPLWVIEHHNKQHQLYPSASKSSVKYQETDSLISDVTPPLSPLSPHVVNDNKIADISFQNDVAHSNNDYNSFQCSNTITNYCDNHETKPNDNNNAPFCDDNVSLIWPSGTIKICNDNIEEKDALGFSKNVNKFDSDKKNILFDRTNLNRNNESNNGNNKSLLEAMKPIKLPQNPFTLLVSTESRSHESDLLPNRDPPFNVKNIDSNDNVYETNQYQQNNGKSPYTDSNNYDNNNDIIEFNDPNEESVSSDGFLRSDSIALLWRKELEQEIQFKQTLPHFFRQMSSKNISVELFKKLVQFWDLAGLPYFARLKTSERLINLDLENKQTKTIIKTMCKKLMKFVEERKRELLAIKKREDMKNKIELSAGDNIDHLLSEKYDKLNVVLERVILRWEETNEQRFLYRGLPYIKILKID
jgi:hypothetical protein